MTADLPAEPREVRRMISGNIDIERHPVTDMIGPLGEAMGWGKAGTIMVYPGHTDVTIEIELADGAFEVGRRYDIVQTIKGMGYAFLYRWMYCVEAYPDGSAVLGGGGEGVRVDPVTLAEIPRPEPPKLPKAEPLPTGDLTGATPEERGFRSCACIGCQSACKHKPGWFMPGEAERLAERMGLTFQELFERHLMIDYWQDEPNVFVLSPAVVNGEPGEPFPYDPTGVCAWYENGRCKVHDLGKPFECAAAVHDTDNDDLHRRVADAWREHQDVIRRLYGDEPYAEEGGGFGLFGSFFR